MYQEKDLRSTNEMELLEMQNVVNSIAYKKQLIETSQEFSQAMIENNLNVFWKCEKDRRKKASNS